MKKIGLYLHFPFCKSKCRYCDFCSVPRAKSETVDAYVSALCREIREKAAHAGDCLVDTVYFGGGTPTLLPVGQISAVCDTLASVFHFAETIEFSVECNPATGDRDLFSELRRFGCNRVSIGLQSIHPNELKALGRIHTYGDFLSTVEMLQAVGIGQINADLMFGIPEQSVKTYLATLDTVTKLDLQHISAYGLILEEGTPFWNHREKLPLPDEEETRKMYFEGLTLLKSRGFLQYEISNFAKVGCVSKHNLKYWNCEPFLGFGVSAYSDFDGERFGNTKDIDAYIRGEQIVADRERPTAEERANEAVMLGMRCNKGIALADIRDRFGADFSEKIGNQLSHYQSGGFVRKTADGYAFTAEGMYVSNYILSDILDF